MALGNSDLPSNLTDASNLLDCTMPLFPGKEDLWNEAAAALFLIAPAAQVAG